MKNLERIKAIEKAQSKIKRGVLSGSYVDITGKHRYKTNCTMEERKAIRLNMIHGLELVRMNLLANL